MTKIIKYVCMAFVALYLISAAIERFEKMKREKARSEQRTYDPANSMGGQMVRNTIDNATDEILPGDDAEPILGEVYGNANGEEWVFSENFKGGLRVSFNKGDVRSFDLEKIGVGAYNTFYPDKYADAGFIIRMIDEGRAIEVQQGKGSRKIKTIFKTASSTLED